jgi:hypothetical protein
LIYPRQVCSVSAHSSSAFQRLRDSATIVRALSKLSRASSVPNQPQSLQPDPWQCRQAICPGAQEVCSTFIDRNDAFSMFPPTTDWMVFLDIGTFSFFEFTAPGFSFSRQIDEADEKALRFPIQFLRLRGPQPSASATSSTPTNGTGLLVFKLETE